MRTTATQNEHYNAHEPVWFMAFELSEKTWKLGFTLGHGQQPRERTITARDAKRLGSAIQVMLFLENPRGTPLIFNRLRSSDCQRALLG